MRFVRPALSLVLLLLFSATVSAQQRPAVPEADYAKWESIGVTELSPRGRWLAWTITRVDGDGALHYRQVGRDSAIVVPYASRPAFSANDRWLAYSIGFSREERERREKSNESTRSKVGLVDLETGATTVLDEIAEFEFSADGSFIVLHAYQPANGGDAGHDIIVRDLKRGTGTAFGNVAEAEWQDGGPLLAMVVHAANRAANGVRTYNPQTGVLHTIESDTARYTGIAWREDDDDLVVLRIQPDEHHEDSTHAIIAWTDVETDDAQRFILDPLARSDFPASRRIVDYREPDWSDDGATIFFGVREWKAKEDSAKVIAAVVSDTVPPDTVAPDTVPPDTVAPDSAGRVARRAADETAGVQVWHAADTEIIPEQKVGENLDRSRSWLATWRPAEGTYAILADSTMRDVTRSEGRIALGLDGTPYERERMFGPRYQDLYAVDIATGERTRFAERIQFQYGPSPNGQFMLYVRDGDYWVYDTSSKRHTNITTDIATSFIDLENDHTIEEKPPYGTGGWTEDERSVLLYDKYDIWEVRADGSSAVALTNGAADRIRYRRVWINPDDRVVDRSKPVHVVMTGERTKQSGYGRILPGDRGFERLVLRDRALSRLTKADSADVYMYRVEGFDDSPDMLVGGPRLADAVQVTNTNAFQAEYAWGQSALIDYVNETGDSLQAALFYPANYEPGRRYPMIVHIYEITSNTLHNYTAPSEYTAYNTAVFTQNGYFVLRPDIVYRGRDPGISAVEALVPAVEKAIATASIDRERIGLIGHSWGGYQTAFTVTQTDLFSAAVAGAPLTNLISMYLSIYWNTGGTDARIFEISQGRMEVPFWEDLDAYMRNSPLFNILRLETPLLVAFGDKDGAVDWHQGIELYNAARRAGKQMVMLVYEGENHSLAKRPNQLDYHRRIMEWFGHYLKGEPAASWIREGKGIGANNF